ncbi:aromatic ring-hydroxylating dioxygenase subunit alpha [Marivibrio halodurans]|uniref:Aromatic ring-hydroxylating dioxygenase subunit alpha n=1 Tax=Marivibrio halodurans TaxID=2039722 RepID=A0A8J7UZI5_9PROT|nr:aromatic ring-hydroxylating dioxygenase subunit alpha [Marivibrio halodurans]MBP5855721.1 aromatic ring-hydroxylating dioxygenase subunit alpha [Marivibrio halodurans]
MSIRDPENADVRREAVHGLPAWTYDNSELLSLEYERLILGTWQVACHQNDVPNPGDYMVFDLMRDSIAIVRDADGTIRAFHNVCRHRGAKLLDGRGTLRRRLLCPYHGWAYALDGRLAGVPAESTFPGLDKNCFGLNTVEHEVFLGFVFVRVAGEGPSLAEMWGDYAKLIEPYRPETMVGVRPMIDQVWNCDWKTAVDNNQENYHIPMGHPGYHRMLDSGMGGFGNSFGIGGSVSRHKDRPSPNWVERMYQDLAPKVLTHLPEEKRSTWQFFSMLPNHGIDVYPDSMDFFQILPLGQGRCQVRLGLYGQADDRREMRVLRYLNDRINRMVLAEDRWLSERVQKGLRSHGYNPGPLSIYEDGVKELHDRVRAACPVTTLTVAPAPGTVAARDAELAAAG